MLFTKAERNRFIDGVKVAKGSKPISHLLFVDDNIIFCRATLPKWQAVQQVLYHYEQASGQCMNCQKSSIFFNINTNRATYDLLLHSAGVTECSNLERYPRLLALVGRAKLFAFQSIKDKVWNRVKIENILFLYKLERKYF